MSLKRMPSVGKSLMSRILALSSDTSMAVLSPCRDDGGHTAARLEAARGFMIAPGREAAQPKDARAAGPGVARQSGWAEPT